MCFITRLFTRLFLISFTASLKEKKKKEKRKKNTKQTHMLHVPVSTYAASAEPRVKPQRVSLVRVNWRGRTFVIGGDAREADAEGAEPAAS